MSERVRRLCCLAGQGQVCSQASELLAEKGGMDITGMQVQRVCTHYGSLLDPLINQSRL